MRSLYVLCFMILIMAIWETGEAYGEIGTPPGEELHILQRKSLLAGERMFRSREFTEAREAFEKVLELDSQDAQAHYFLGLIEYEEGNVEKAKVRFQISHECLGTALENLGLSADVGELDVLPNDKQVQLEFSDEYEAKVYYKDGWYLTEKKAAYGNKGSYGKEIKTLEAGSTYRIDLKSGRKESWGRRFAIGLVLALTFFLAR